MAVKVMVAVYAVLPAKVAGVPFQATVPVYWSVSVIAVTGVAPSTGAITPDIAAMLITVSGAAPVAGNTAVTTPELSAFVAVAPATVKLFAATPVSVKPALAVKVMVAVYTVLAPKVAGVPFQATVPVYCAVSVIAVTGVAPSTGAVTPGIAAMLITVSGAAPVAGNTAVTTPELTAFVAVAPATVKLFAATPVSVNPALAVKVMVAVYTVLPAKVAGVPLHVTVPVYCAVAVIAVTGVAPSNGAVTPGIATMLITVSVGGVTGLGQWT